MEEACSDVLELITGNAESSEIFILSFTKEDQFLLVQPFTSEQLENALAKYAKLEQTIESNEHTTDNVVLVHAKGVEQLRLAYPNYSANTPEYVRKVRSISFSHNSYCMLEFHFSIKYWAFQTSYTYLTTTKHLIVLLPLASRSQFETMHSPFTLGSTQGSAIKRTLRQANHFRNFWKQVVKRLILRVSNPAESANSSPYLPCAFMLAGRFT